MRSLIAQLIPLELCFARQREFYHKCHRCRFRGRPAEEVTLQAPLAPANGRPPGSDGAPARRSEAAGTPPGTRT